MIGVEETLKRSLNDQETLAKEMSHRVKNFFALADGMIRASARNAESPLKMAEDLSARMHALATAHSLVRRNFDDLQIGTTDIAALVRAITRPYDSENNVDVQGVPVALGEHATNGLALMFHELATNSAKYGALSQHGTVRVAWTVHGEQIIIVSQETGGPAIAGEPTKRGFGTTLVQRTATSQFGGTIRYDWQGEGAIVYMSLAITKLGR
jgi:two-component sensor histidine kinase